MDSTSPFLLSYADSNMDGSKGKAKPTEGSSHHHRCNSESFLIEEQPSWLDDLLNEPAETTTVVHKGHRRSASDTFAYLGAATWEETKNKNVNIEASWGSVNYVSYKDLSAVSYDTKTNSSHEQIFSKAAQEVNGAPSGYKLCIRCRDNKYNNSISSRNSRTTLNIVETKAGILKPNLATSQSRTMKPVPAGFR